MAGIGFTLRRMLGEEGLVGPLKAFAYSALIASGPWLTSSVALAMLGMFSALGSGSEEGRIFLALVSYAFAFSLVGVGCVQMVASRFLADQLYTESAEGFSPAFVQLLVPLLVIQLLVAVTFFQFVPLPLGVEALAVVFYLALNGTWLAMVFLSAAQDYRAIVAAFAGGWGLSLAGGYWGSHMLGLTGQMAGFAAGSLATFLVLAARIDREFGVPKNPVSTLWPAFKTYWQLALLGFAYNLATWIDKILFWSHSETGESVAGALKASPVYDNAMFLSYLTIIPALALFLMKVETDFFDAYRGYFARIASRENLAKLKDAKADMVRAMRQGLGLMLKVQGAITLAVILLTPEIAAWLNLSWLSLFVFRTGTLGAFLHVLHLSVLVLMLYFDFRREATWLALTFLGTNTLFTLASFAGGLPAYGYGYALSGAVTLFVGLLLLDRNLEDLEYHVFMKQPL
ncbi:hypothetical protein D3C86_624900 [compost metagenome]